MSAIQVGSDVIVTFDEGSHVATDGVFLIGRNPGGHLVLQHRRPLGSVLNKV